MDVYYESYVRAPYHKRKIFTVCGESIEDEAMLRKITPIAPYFEAIDAP